MHSSQRINDITAAEQKTNALLQRAFNEGPGSLLTEWEIECADSLLRLKHVYHFATEAKARIFNQRMENLERSTQCSVLIQKLFGRPCVYVLIRLIPDSANIDKAIRIAEICQQAKHMADASQPIVQSIAS